MIEAVQVAFSSAFEKAFKKLVKKDRALAETFWSKVDRFLADPFDPTLRTHKLTGQLRDLWSFSVTYEIRVIFYFADGENAVFTDLGGHDSVY